MNIPLIESMLLSKDEEIRKLAFNYIKNNYDINFKVYFDLSKYKYSLSEESSEYFVLMEHILNSIIEGNYFSTFYIQDAIKLILKYNKNMNRDTLIELLNSKDVESRKLGISFLINNINLPKILYYVYNDYGYYYTYAYPKNERVSFSLYKKKYLNWLEDQFTSDRQKTILLSAIFKYNEEYK